MDQCARLCETGKYVRPVGSEPFGHRVRFDIVEIVQQEQGARQRRQALDRRVARFVTNGHGSGHA